MKNEWKIWKIIKLGTHKDAEALSTAIKNAGMIINEWGNDILGKRSFKVAPKENNIILTRKTVGELGFKTGAKYKCVCTKEVGQTTIIDDIEYEITLCPNEVGPQLRLQYPDQPKGEWLRIAMEPITDSILRPNIFIVAQHDGELYLKGSNGHDDNFVCAESNFVFCLSKKISA